MTGYLVHDIKCMGLVASCMRFPRVVFLGLGRKGKGLFGLSGDVEGRWDC